MPAETKLQLSQVLEAAKCAGQSDCLLCTLAPCALQLVVEETLGSAHEHLISRCPRLPNMALQVQQQQRSPFNMSVGERRSRSSFGGCPTWTGIHGKLPECVEDHSGCFASKHLSQFGQPHENPASRAPGQGQGSQGRAPLQSALVGG